MNNYRNYGTRKTPGMDSSRIQMPKKQDCGGTAQNVAADCGCTESRNKGDCGCTESRNKADCGCNVEELYSAQKNKAEEGIMAGRMTDLSGKPIAMAYVPWQIWTDLYEICDGFRAGTIFKELDLGFDGRRCN